MNLNLTPYTALWDKSAAGHLLRRVTFSPSLQNINNSVTLGLEETIDELFQPLDLTSVPINYLEHNDIDVAFGETWIDKPYSEVPGVNPVSHRTKSLQSWIMKNMMEHSFSITPCLTLFWHNHFCVQKSIVPDPKVLYPYFKTLWNNATGNFKDFVKHITIDPAMLIYLNGHSNSKFAPNENYSRELLELFTIGKGPIVLDGDYTNYTEKDVKEIARCLTGWQVKGMWDHDGIDVSSDFIGGYHDIATKVLSHRFGFAQIANAGEEEYNNVIDIIFQQEEVSKFIVRKFYRWFVSYKIDNSIETAIITPLAQILRDNDYNIIPVLKTLLKSEHFFDAELRGSQIKNPHQFLISIFNQFQIQLPSDITEKYHIYEGLHRLMESLQMPFLEPPNVAGWKAYYQEPNFYKLWINATTLTHRIAYINYLSTSSIQISNTALHIDVSTFIQDIPNWDNPRILIRTFLFLLLPTAQKNQDLEDCLLPYLTNNLPEYSWTNLCSYYLSSPATYGGTLRAKLRSLIKAILNLPDYQLN